MLRVSDTVDQQAWRYYARARRARIRGAHAEHHLSDLKDEALQPRTIAVYM
jgi:phage tail protein X